MRNLRTTRHGSVLLGVLVVVMIASMVGLSMMSAASAQRGDALGTLRRGQTRALAWSGVLAVVSQLESQRADILAGKEPDLKRAWSLGDGGVVRLVVPTGSTGLASSESAKLDINRATPEMLAKFEDLAAGVVPRTVHAREEHPFASAEELSRVPGLSASFLYGSGNREAKAQAGGGQPAEVKDVSPMLSRFTVFSTDGIFRAEADGPDDRLRCDKEWSQEDRQRAATLLGEQLATSLDSAIKGAKGFHDESQIVRALRGAKVDSKQWGKVLDAITPATGEVSMGKVDINHASAEVLAAIPGIDHEHAAAIVSTRESLSPSLRANAAWLVAQGVLSEDAFEQAVPWLTARSTMWRVRVEAGFRKIEESAEASELEDAEIVHRSALEAVIDITDERVRVAYLRDVTYLEAELALEESGRASAEASLGPKPSTSTDVPPPATREPPPPAPEPERPSLGHLSLDRGSTSSGSESDKTANATSQGSPSSGASSLSRIGRWTRGGSK